jgi:protein SCO1/2
MRALPFFQLTDTEQQDFTNARLKNAWSLVYFGSTHCTEHCTATLTTLNQIYQQFANQPENILQIIFISTNPQDSPQKVQNYLDKFNKNFKGITGSATEIKNFTQALNALYTKAAPTLPPENFSMDHSDIILIINPVGKWIGVFNTPLNANIVSQDMLQLMQ